ncbi:hypothetical protein ACHABQ_06115 [Nesterenkonia aurantiaca]|uniref:hypothetical protein n=1 Tax=Nesterenkonia aurantiaca TaxID=1436010 RepID=UPI003EE7F8DD
MGRLLGDRDHAVFTEGFAALNARMIAPLTARFAALDADTPDTEIQSLIEEMISVLRPVQARFADLSLLEDQVIALMDELSERRLHPAQRRVLGRIQEQMEALEDAETGSDSSCLTLTPALGIGAVASRFNPRIRTLGEPARDLVDA